MNGFGLIFWAECARVLPLLPVYTLMAWTFTILHFVWVQQHLSMLHSPKIQISGNACWVCYFVLT
jgi:hypothetical protein